MRNRIEAAGSREYLPRLAPTLTGCIRWRWDDLECALAEQLAMLSRDELEGTAPRHHGKFEPRRMNGMSNGL